MCPAFCTLCISFAPATAALPSPSLPSPMACLRKAAAQTALAVTASRPVNGCAGASPGSLRNASFQAAANRKLVAPDFGPRPTRQNPEQTSTQQDAEQPAAPPASQQPHISAPVRQQQRRSQLLSPPDAGGISGRPGPTQPRPGKLSGQRGPAQDSHTSQPAGNARQEAAPSAASVPIRPQTHSAAGQATSPAQKQPPAGSSPTPAQDANFVRSATRLDGKRGSDITAASSSEPGDADVSTPIRDLLLERNIVLRQYAPGQHNGLLCPQCQGGSHRESSFNVHIDDDGRFVAALRCRVSQQSHNAALLRPYHTRI